MEDGESIEKIGVSFLGSEEDDTQRVTLEENEDEDIFVTENVAASAAILEEEAMEEELSEEESRYSDIVVELIELEQKEKPKNKCLTHKPKLYAHSLSAAPKKYRDQLKQKIRDSLPVMTNQEVRRHRIPYHEARYLDLEEDGFVESAAYFDQLIKNNIELRESAGKHSVLWTRPTIMDLPHVIDKLVDGLQVAETAKLRGDILVEVGEFLRLAMGFMDNPDLDHLADQLFLTAIQNASFYRADGGRKEAVARFIYGQFLVTHYNYIEEASVHLHIARELSKQKKWIASPEVEGAFENLFRQICSALYSGMLKLSQRIRKTNPQQAADYCAIAFKRALEADRDDAIAATVMEQGLCMLSTGDLTNALSNFRETLKRSLAAENHISACEAHLQISKTFIKMNDFIRGEKHLKMMLRLAEIHKLDFSMGKAHQALGEFYLHSPTDIFNSYKKAVSEFEKAMEIFNQLGKNTDLSATRAMHAVAKGQQLMKQFFKTVLKAGDPEDKGCELTKLIQWKIDRTPFWPESESESSSSVGEEETIEEEEGEEEESLRDLSNDSFGAKISPLEQSSISIGESGSSSSLSLRFD